MFTISQIAKIINGKIDGDPNLKIQGVCDIKDGKSNFLSYITSEKYKESFIESNVTAVIVNKNFNIDKGDKTLIYVDSPANRFIDIINLFHPKETISDNIHSSANIASSVKIGKNVNIEANVVIDEDVIIGDNIKIGAGVYIGKNTIIQNNCIIYPNVTIYHNIKIGIDCIIDSGSIIGSDGFGLVKDNNSFKKMPHIGGVVIKNNVWIGANCCVDRGTLGDTIIGEGSKLDNLIQIAHNVKIGKNCRISGQTAIAGSTIIEDNVTLAGQVGIIDHLNIGKGTIVASKSAVYQSLKPNSFVSGIPARYHKERLRQDVVINQLPDILNRIRKLEK